MKLIIEKTSQKSGRYEIIDFSDPRDPQTLCYSNDEDGAISSAINYSAAYSRVEVYDSFDDETIYAT